MNDENSSDIAGLAKTAGQISGEKRRLLALREELCQQRKPSSDLVLAEKEYVRRREELLVRQNAMNNKLIMLVNERTRAKDSISGLLIEVKDTEKKVAGLEQQIQGHGLKCQEDRDWVAAAQIRIQASRDMLERLDFPSKVRSLAVLSRAIEEEGADYGAAVAAAAGDYVARIESQVATEGEALGPQFAQRMHELLERTHAVDADNPLKQKLREVVREDFARAKHFPLPEQEEPKAREIPYDRSEDANNRRISSWLRDAK